MGSEVAVFALLIFYKIATLVSGVCVIFMGYKLFSSGIERTPGELEAKASRFSLVFRTAAPGTFFALFGALIIGVSVFRGASYVPKAADVHISDMPVETPTVPILIPTSPPQDTGVKK
ncbi:MAG: hypothetical protein WCO22_16510 [Betaproteobacteria bacterium]